MKLKLLLLAVFIVASNVIYAQNTFGLRFKSKEVEKKLRTGLDLTFEGAIPYEHSFKIKFDISFRSYEGFGYIFRLKDIYTAQQIDLICKLDEVSPGLYIIINGRETHSRIRLEKIPQKSSKNWNNVELGYDEKSGTIQLTYNKVNISEKIKFPIHSKFVLGFGVVNKYGFDTKEVPFISVRSVSIFTDGIEKHNWILEHKDGEYPADNINGQRAQVINPEWEVYHHAKWKLVSTFELPEKPKIAYDSETEKIFMVCDNQNSYYYDLNSNKLDSISYKGLPPVNEKDNQLIIGHNSQLLVYSHQANILSGFDWKLQAWNPQIKNNDSLPIYWHHNKLFNPITNKITTICGYGFYTYKSSILEYDDSLTKWVKINFKGDSIFPRYLSALGPNPKNPNQYYLFGGLGNKTGDQLLGTQFYYDLYLIDFEYKTIKRLWQLDFHNSYDVTPINSLIVDTVNDCFYTLCFAHNDEKTFLKIIKASLSRPEYEFLTDSIPYYFIDIQSYADLYYWQSKRKLVAITACQSTENGNEVQIYTIQFPPASLSEAAQSNLKIKPGMAALLIIFFVLLSGAAGYTLYKYRKRHLVSCVDSLPQEEKSILNTSNQSKTEILKPGSINLFGGFQAIDVKGNNITYRFSPTLSELFILMLLNSYEDCKGIPSYKLNETLWPEKSDLSAKNNRGVNMAKLRNILADIGDIQIVHENSVWKLELDHKIECDFYIVYNTLSKTTAGKLMDLSLLYQIIKYLKRGGFLININADWLDKYKGEFSSLVVQFFESQITLFKMEEHTNLILEISNVIFLYDQLNETALRYKCRVLTFIGGHGVAIKTYNDFIIQYQSIYGEEFKISFKQILKD